MCHECDYYDDEDYPEDEIVPVRLSDMHELDFKAGLLDRLEKAGVHNWPGYSFVIEAMADELDEMLELDTSDHY